MRELPTHELIGRIIEIALGEKYGDGYIVTDVCTGYAEPGYGRSDDAIVVFGNWNDKRPAYGWNVKNQAGDRYTSAPNITKADTLPSRLARVLEAAGAEIEWLDEWSQCSHCYRAVRTEPDSYSWTPYFAWVGECEIVCADCLRANPDWIIDEYINNPEKALTVLGVDELTTLGFVQHDARYESGWYGREDNPTEILKGILKFAPEGTEVVFTIDSVGQFDAHFSAWLRTPETDEDDEPETCPGHESTSGPIGNVTFCDGTCISN